MSYPNRITHTAHACKILIVAVGGAGGNAANNMVINKLKGVEILVANTDAQALDNSLVEKKILLGAASVTKGLGAGSDPSVGARAAEESLDEFLKILEEFDMVFFTAGMGGGTGSGATQKYAEAAKQSGKLVVAVVTKPFDFEGAKRKRIAENSIEELKNSVDTLIVISNQNLFKMSGTNTTFQEAFGKADSVLYQTVKGITELITKTGLINLDFADVKSVMKDKGYAIVGFGNNMKSQKINYSYNNKSTTSTAPSPSNNPGPQQQEKSHGSSGTPGPNIQEEYFNNLMTVEETIMTAMKHPLLDENLDLSTAQALLINVTGGTNLTIAGADIISRKVHEQIKNKEVHILVGATISEEIDPNEIDILIIATGLKLFPENQENKGSFEANYYINNENIYAPQALENPYNQEKISNLSTATTEEFPTVNTTVNNLAEPKKKSLFGRLFGSFKSSSDKKDKEKNSAIYNDSVIDFLYSEQKDKDNKKD